MADEADVANDYLDGEVSRALREIRKNIVPKAGSKTCQDCGENIPEARRNLGFQSCVACAEESERRKALYADY